MKLSEGRKRRLGSAMDSERSTASSRTTFSAERRGIVRYLAVGGTAAAIDIGLFVLFARYLGMPYLRVAAGTFVVATLANYLLSVRFVFVSGQRFRRRWEIALVFAVSAAGLALNALILWACVEGAGADLLAAKVAATGVVFFWNFIARRVFVFGALRD
jgi:putative flippase GtrA